MNHPFLKIAFVCGLALLFLQDALAARRSLRVDFESWNDGLELGSENCPGSSPEDPDVTWRGIVFSGSASTEFNVDAYCQEANQKGLEFEDPFEYLSDESTPFDEPGLAALIGPNDDIDLSKRVTAIRYTYLDEDRFSDDPLPQGFQWAFYQFPDNFTIVALYGDIDNSLIIPVIHDPNGTIWSEAEDGFDGEYFCFDENTFIGTWDGEPDDGSPLSYCEFILKELIFTGGFEVAGGYGIYPP